MIQPLGSMSLTVSVLLAVGNATRAVAQGCHEHENIVAPDGQGISGRGPGDWLGTSLAVSGDVLVTGAPLDVVDGVRRGSVRVFHRRAGGAFVHEQT
jgi:hypothetical protein